jgi:hypothetical protein
VLTQTTARKTIRPPSGFEDHLCRRDAAALLGFASEFKVRQLEKEGRLRAIRGSMGSAWYPRGQIEALRGKISRPLSPTAPRVRWPDDALIALLREKPRTVVDLVVDAGISISRAERVYRFWLAHEGPGQAPGAAESARPPKEPAERRSGERLEHDALVRQLRDADPKVRVAAFEQLRSQRR